MPHLSEVKLTKLEKHFSEDNELAQVFLSLSIKDNEANSLAVDYKLDGQEIALIQKDSNGLDLVIKKVAASAWLKLMRLCHHKSLPPDVWSAEQCEAFAIDPEKINSVTLIPQLELKKAVRLSPQELEKTAAKYSVAAIDPAPVVQAQEEVKPTEEHKGVIYGQENSQKENIQGKNEKEVIQEVEAIPYSPRPFKDRLLAYFKQYQLKK